MLAGQAAGGFLGRGFTNDRGVGVVIDPLGSGCGRTSRSLTRGRLDRGGATVVIDGEILGKPIDMDDARRMLRLLSGNWHEVLTGVAVVENGSTRFALQRTRVKFIEMSDDEIEFLAAKGDPLDKAGAYAVQAQAALFIEKVEGEYWNVVGLPINLVYKLIMQKGETITASP